MLRPIFLRTVLAVCSFFGTVAFAQEPPILLRMIREPNLRAAAEIGQAFASSRATTNVFAASSTTGPAETLFFEVHESYASIEDMDKAANVGRLSERSATFSTILLHIPGLSFRPDLAAKLLPRARYFQISTYRIRPGSGAEFAELMRIRRAAYDAINLDRPEMAYQVVSGGVNGSYVMIAPLTSLKTLDTGTVRNPAYAAALGDSGVGFRKLSAEIELVREQQLLRIEPELSYVSDDWAEMGAGFWHPKFKNR